MNDSNNIHSLSYVNNVIDRYFEGTSTPADEKWLKSLLTRPQEAPEIAIDGATAERLAEVLAVMSYSMVATRRQPVAPPMPQLQRWRVVASIAAAIVVLVAIGIYFFVGGDSPFAGDDATGEYIAYVDGRIVNDPDEVMSLMHNELRDISMQSKEPQEMFEMQLQDIREGLNDINVVTNRNETEDTLPI